MSFRRLSVLDMLDARLVDRYSKQALMIYFLLICYGTLKKIGSFDPFFIFSRILNCL